MTTNQHPTLLTFRLIIILSVLFLHFSITCFGQENPEKLKKSFISINNDKEKFNISLSLVKYYMYSDNDSCDYFLDQCFLISNKLNSAALKGTYHLTSAKVEKLRSNYNNAMDQSLKALSYFESAGKVEGTIEANTLIGHIYALRKEYEKSFPYYDFSIQKARDEGLPLYKINALIGKGNVLYYLDSLDLAQAFLEEAILLSEKFNPQDKKATAGLYTNTGNLHLGKKDYLKAVYCYKKGFDNYYKLNDKYGMSLTAYNIGDAFLSLNEYDSSKKYFNINLFLGKELKNPEEIKFAYKGFTNLYEKQGDFQSALEMHYLYVDYADSVRSRQYNAQLEALTQKYEENEKLKLAEEKLVHSEEMNEKQRLINTILYIAIFVALITMVIVFILYRRSVKASNLLKEKSEEIERQNLKIDRALQQKDTLLKEVHHRVKNNLQLIASLLNLQSSTIEDESAIKAIEESKSRVQAIALMHKGLYQDENYSFVDLKSYVDELVDNLKTISKTSERTVNYQVEVDPIFLEIDKAVPIGLILSELISNSLKHAFNDTDNGIISISVRENDKTIELNYADTGRGLPENFNIKDQESLGFTVIQALTEQIDGNLTISCLSPLKLEIVFAK